MLCSLCSYFISPFTGNVVEMDEGSFGSVVEETETRTALKRRDESSWESDELCDGIKVSCDFREDENVEVLAV